MRRSELEIVDVEDDRSTGALCGGGDQLENLLWGAERLTDAIVDRCSTMPPGRLAVTSLPCSRLSSCFTANSAPSSRPMAPPAAPAGSTARNKLSDCCQPSGATSVAKSKPCNRAHFHRGLRDEI